MDISIGGSLATDYIKNTLAKSDVVKYKGEDKEFGSIFQAALDMLNETNDLQNAAEVEEMKWMLGYSENTHDLAIAQEKANVAIQYTVAVRDRVLDAYKEIMNMQI